MIRQHPITIFFLVVIGLLAGSAAAFAYSKDQPPATTWPTNIEQDVVAASPAAADAACAGGPVIDGITLDECYVHNFSIGADARTVRVWYTKNPVTATRMVDGNPVVLSHWIDTDAQAVQVADWFEDAWRRYHADSGHHLYTSGCSNRLNVQMEDGIGWSGIAYWASSGNCNIGIDSPMVRGGGGQWTVYHEAQHYLQYSYDDGCYGSWQPNYPDNSEFVEGYADLGADSVNAALDAIGYNGNGYNASTSMYDKSYGNRFNKYFIEQLGTTGTPADPWHHMDALYAHYQECDVQDDLYVLDSLVPSLSGGKWSLNQFFLNFFAANWAMAWADQATQPELTYWDDDAGAYSAPSLTQDVSMASGTQSWVEATPDDYAAKYYQIRPQTGCPFVQLDVDGAAGAQLGINLMAADTSAPTRVLRSAKIGEDYTRTFAGAGVNDRLVVVVNSFANNYNYTVTATCVSPTINILEPRQVKFALVGAPDSPITYLARWNVKDGTANVRGLVESSFSFSAEGGNASIVAGSFQEVGDEYWAVLLPPVKPLGTTFVDFTACLETAICDSETDALLYVPPGNTDIALSFDASGSMATEDVIGEGSRLSNAQRAGNVVADLLRPGDRIAVLDWSATDVPVGCGLPGGDGDCPFDPGLLLSRRDVTSPTLTTRINETRAAVNTISARAWTPVGSGAVDAKNKLVAAPFSLNPKHIFLLSDGAENVNPLYAAVKNELVDSGVVINTIGFGPEAPGNLLAQIAADTGGIYRPVPTSASGAGMVAAASVDQLATIDATDEMKALLAAPVLPGQLGLADVYDYFDTEAQDAARVFHMPFENITTAEYKQWQGFVDKSVNQMRFVFASQQGESSGCEGYHREVEVLPPGADVEKGWIPIHPISQRNPPPADWDIRNNVFDDVLIVPNPAEGMWKFRARSALVICATAAQAASPDVATATGDAFMMNMSVQSTIQLEGRILGLTNNQGVAGDTATILGMLLDRNGTVKGATMLAAIQSARGQDLLLLKDDGAHNDGAADDGIYGALYGQTTVGGSYNVRILSTFKDPANPANNLFREWNGGFWIDGPRPDQKCDERTDKDCDGMPDDWERRCKLDITKNDALGDLDQDGLTNIDEFNRGTLPCRADTDKGGERDGSEVKYGRNPLDPQDDKVLTLGHINVRPLNTRVLIDWRKPISYTDVLVYVSTDSNVLGLPTSMCPQGQCTGDYMLEGLENDKTYYLRLTGKVGDFEGDYSDPIAVTPKLDPDMPSGAMLIENGAEVVKSKQVVLNISSTDTPLNGAAQGANAHLTDRLSLIYNEVSGGVEMRIANDESMAGAEWEPLAAQKPWTLACADGQVCTVFAQFRDAANNESLVVNDFVVLDEDVIPPTGQQIFLPLVSNTP